MTQLAKATLRKEIKEKLCGVSLEDQKVQSQQIIEKLLNWSIYKNSKRISIYLSTDNEVSTTGIIENIFQDNKQCYVPRYNKSVMEMVKLHSMKDWYDLPLTKWKIKQPHLDENRENAVISGGLDLIILPGVAFTATGKRLGHGKGYYDKFLTNLTETQTKRPITVALAFKEQILNDIPTHKHDFIVDYVLYPN